MKTVYATPRRGTALPAAVEEAPETASEPAEAPRAEPELPAIPRGLLPHRLTELLSYTLRGRQGNLEEIRLRADRRTTLTVDGENLPTPVVLTTADLTAYIKSKLPRYMIPNVTRQLDQLPLTPNGKIDRNLLKKLYEKK